MSRYEIKVLQKKYFQKSRVFFYPILKIKRGGKFLPTETYMSWDNKYSIDDCRFFILYPNSLDKEYRKFELEKLIGNKYYEDMTIVNQGLLYVFNLTPIKKEWDKIVNGKYSALPEEYKRMILDSYDVTGPQFPYIESYLYPDKYIDIYAHLLDVKKNDLVEVGELCSRPDLTMECLKADVYVLNISTE